MRARKGHFLLVIVLLTGLASLGWGLSARFSSVATIGYSFKVGIPGEPDLTLAVSVPLPDYRHYRERPRPSYGDNLTWNEMAVEFLDDAIAISTDPGDDAIIDSAARQFEAAALAGNLDSGEAVKLVLKFAQSLTYTTDNVSTSSDQYPRYPVETLFEQTGDCEDTSLLAAAILTEMGYDTAFILFEEFDHMGLGIYFPAEWGIKMYGNSWIYGDSDNVVADGERRYWYLDTSGKRAMGWAPPEYGQTPAYIYPVGG